MIKKVLTLGFCIALLLGCKSKFSVNGEYIEKPVVHLLLDQGENYHFLKLNKTFLKEGNAYDYAKDPSLSYFDNVVATVKEIGGQNRTWTLKDTTITNKKEGVFYAPKQKLYYFKANDLDEDALYRLNIDINNGEFTVTAQTKLVSNVNISYPKPNFSFNFADNNVQINGYKSTPITFSLGSGAVYKVQLKINYREYTTSGQSDKTILWNLGSKDRLDIPTSTSTIPASGEKFYELLSKKIAVNSNVTKRTLQEMEIILTAGSEDLQTYMLTNKPTSSLAQNKPSYSNVEGALGIFSSRVTIKQTKAVYSPPNKRALNQNSTKELCTGTYTVALNFCSDIPLDNSAPYACN